MKFKAFAVTKADANADIDLVNKYSLEPLTPDDVFCFSAVLTNNDIDRDMECMSDKSLNSLPKMLLGKTGILDHSWSMKNQVARLYRLEVTEPGGKNFKGEPLKELQGSAYILRNADTQPIIDKILGGIVKEISIGFQAKSVVCSICGTNFAMDWNDYKRKCANGHIKGEVYDNVQCAGLIDDVTDAYEFSFVAVPANRGAGAVKGFKSGTSIHEAFLEMSAEQLSNYREANEAVIKHLQAANTSAEEMAHRAELRKYAEENL